MLSVQGVVLVFTLCQWKVQGTKVGLCLGHKLALVWPWLQSTLSYVTVQGNIVTGGHLTQVKLIWIPLLYKGIKN